eukprot:CAMPEP_0194109928 /NCGR_PEP_ID=MMETSP0150-20130528/9310_1 /TAXON_ID=122233 /ORGANISM="Chaetoceros debilis, Strain MM31A-1" /LENGTH=427 /DNA_ID=CAMNT_0038798989 /DNA_START=48 /DNA_END=1331 /DNA_ORIENTATION=-
MENGQYPVATPYYSNSNRAEEEEFCNDPSYSSSYVTAVGGGEEPRRLVRNSTSAIYKDGSMKLDSKAISQLRDCPPSEMQQTNEEGFSLNCQLPNFSSQTRDDPRQDYRSGAYIYDRYGPNENDGNHKKRKTGPSDDEHSQRYQHDLRTHRPFVPDSTNPDMSLLSAFAVPHEMRHDYHPYSMNAMDQSGYYHHPGPYFQGDFRSRSPHPGMMASAQLPLSQQRAMFGVHPSHAPFAAQNRYYNGYGNADLNNHHPSELWSAEPTQEMYKPKSKNKRLAPPVDKPRRPLTAYNFFFSEEREVIIAQLPDEESENDSLNKEGDKENSDSKSLPVILSKMRTLTDEEKDKIREVTVQKTQNMLKIHMESQRVKKTHAKVHGKIAFQQLAKIIGQRWRNLDKEQKSYYDDVAAKDSNRYQEQMSTFGSTN